MRHSYRNQDDAILLLTDMTGKVCPVSMEERAEMVAMGKPARSVVIKEYEVPDRYREIVHRHMGSFLQSTAEYVGRLAEQLYQDRGEDLVLVDIVRAGIPIGILVRRYLKQFHDIDVPHYGISLVDGLDPVAMKYLLDKHGSSGIQFIDGWVGKGTVTREIVKCVTQKWPSVNPGLAVLSDCTGMAQYAGTYMDAYIPHSPLNAAATGLVSITVKNEKYHGKTGFHAAVYLEELEGVDESQEFVDRVCTCFTKQPAKAIHGTTDDLPIYCGETERLAHALGRDAKLLNPGVNEAARAVLRRELEKLLVQDMDNPEVLPLMELAQFKGVPVREYPDMKGYLAVSVAKDDYMR